MRRFLRWRVLLVLLVLLGGSLGGGWLYTQSAHASRTVSRKLEDRLGVPARIAGLDVGFGSTAVSSLEIHEREAAPEARPWLRVGHTEVDVSALGAILGSEPKTLVLKDAEVFLRFDRKGDLLTKFPQANSSSSGPLPNIRVEAGTLVIQQEGHLDSIINGVNLQTTTENGQIVLTGEVQNADWGRWNADGRVDLAKNDAQFRLTMVGVKHVTQELLEKTPFVNPNAWKAVKLEGHTPAELTIRFDLATEAVTYRMTMEPTRTKVYVPMIGLTVENCAGTLVAEGATVTLKNVTGTTADGKVFVNSKMDFGGIDDVLQFSTEFQKANVKKLPKLWSVPEAIEGDFGGKVDFVLAILQKGGVRTNGQGTATIANAKIAGVPTAPIKLTMRPARFIGFEFAPDEPLKKDPMAPPAKKDTPEAPKPMAKKDAIKDSAGLFTGLLNIASRIIKPKDAPKEDRDYIHVNLTFRDIQFVELLKTARVTLPVNLQGKVTVQVQLDIPTNAPGEMSNYRLSGDLSSAKLNIEGIEVADVKAKLRLRDGSLAISDFTGRLPLLGNADQGGAFKSQFTIELGKKYAFKGNVLFENLDLKRSEQLKNVLPLPVDLGGLATLNADLEGTFSPFDIKTKGKAEAKQLLIAGLPIDEVRFRWESNNEQLKVEDLTAKLLTGEVTGGLTVPLLEAQAGSGQLKLKDVDLSELSKVLPDAANLKLEGKANGIIQVRVPAAGEGQPREAKAEVELSAPKLKLQNITAEKIKGSGNYIGGVLSYKLVGEALGGSFELEGQFPPNPPKKNPPKPKAEEKQPGFLEGFRSLRFRNVKLSQLLARFGQTSTLGSLEAEITGDIPFTIGAGLQLTGVGKIRADRLRWGNTLIAPTGVGTMRLTSKELRLEEAVLPLGEGFANVWITLNRTDIDRSTAGLTLSNVPANKLLFLFPEFAGQIDLPVDGRLTSNIGREWRGSGVLTGIKGKIYGIPVADVRLPISWIANFDRQFGTLTLMDLAGTAAKGRATGKAELAFFADRPLKLAGEIKFTNINASSAFPTAGNYAGNTPLSGKFTFGSEQLRATNDLTGKLEATLGGDAQPFGLPVFSSLVPFLGFGRDAATIVNAGDVKASLSNGVWRVQQLTLTGPALNVYAEGTVTTSGRLNAFVAGSTGRSGLSPSIAGRVGTLASQLLSAPLSRNALNEAIGVLGNFVVYLDVAGTVENPTVRLQTVRTVSEGAVRFFLMQYAPR